MQNLLQAAGVEAGHLRKLKRFGDSGIPRSLLGPRPRSATGGGSTIRVRWPAATAHGRPPPLSRCTTAAAGAGEELQACGQLPCGFSSRRSVLQICPVHVSSQAAFIMVIARR